MSLLERLKTSVFWVTLPALAVAVLVRSAMAGYDPLTFDPSLYEIQTADAAELEDVDAEAIEAEHGAEEPADVQLDTPPSAAGGKLADGSWTGYAACGKGNPDGWKPYYVGVTLTVAGGKVKSVDKVFGSSTGNSGSASLNWDASENQKYLDWAVSGHGGSAGVKAQLSVARTVSSVDTVSGATYSSAAIFNAYIDALKKSAAAAGGSVHNSQKVDPSQKSKQGESSKVSSDKVGSNKKVGELADGAWTGYAQCGPDPKQDWKPYYVGVTLTVAGGKVKSVDKVFGSSSGNSGDAKLKWDESENQKYLGWAISGRDGASGVKSQLSVPSVVSDIDTVSGATYSSAAIFNAYLDALSKSAAAAGATLEVPDGDDSPKAPENPGESEAGEIGTGSDVDDPVGDGELADGAWTGYAQCGPDPKQDWKPYYVGVTLTVAGGKVKSVDEIFGSSTGDSGAAKLEWDASENQQYLDGAASGVGVQIADATRSGQLATAVDAVSGATYSSRAIFKAYYAALAKSAQAAGSTVDEPDDRRDDSPAADDAEVDSPADAGSGDSDNSGDSGDSGDASTGVFYGFAYCSSSGSDSWDPYYLFVQVSAENGAVTAISKAYADADGVVDPQVLYSASQNGTYLDWAIEGKFGGTGYRMKSVVKQIQAKIEAGAPGDTSGISTVSGATRSSRAIIAAYQMALQNAAAGVGTTPEEAVALAVSEG